MSAALNLCTLIESEGTPPPLVRIESNDPPPIVRIGSKASPPIVISTLSTLSDSEGTPPPLVRIESSAPPPIVRIFIKSPPPIVTLPIDISTHAPNCLFSVNNLKELIDPEISCCPVYTNTRRKLKDGDADGLECSFFIECEICVSKDLELRYSFYNLRKVLHKNLGQKDRTRILNKTAITKRKIVNVRKSRVGKYNETEKVISRT